MDDHDKISHSIQQLNLLFSEVVFQREQLTKNFKILNRLMKLVEDQMDGLHEELLPKTSKLRLEAKANAKGKSLV